MNNGAHDQLQKQKSRQISCPVVGIGASAGGLSSINRFFDSLPGDTHLAYVVVLHLDPTHESELVSIIARHTTMPVILAKGKIVPECKGAQDLIQYAPLAIGIFDSRLRLVQVNDRFCQLVGVENSNLSGLDFLTLIYAEDRQESKAYLNQVL